MKPRARTWTWVAAAHCLVLALPCACGGGAGNHPDADASGGSGGQQIVDGSMDQIADGPGSNGDAPADQGSATDAGADAGGSGACLGACVESLLAQCPRAGMNCVSSTSTIDISHYTTTACYANGVERQLVMAGTTTMTTVKKANGDICYTATADSAAATEDFFDAAGNPVAHLVFGTPLTSVTVNCSDGTVTHGDLSLPACADFTSGTSACTQGTCTW